MQHTVSMVQRVGIGGSGLGWGQGSSIVRVDVWLESLQNGTSRQPLRPHAQEAKNERLWFKTNLKLCGLWFKLKEYGRAQKILRELHKCARPTCSASAFRCLTLHSGGTALPSSMHLEGDGKVQLCSFVNGSQGSG